MAAAVVLILMVALVFISLLDFFQSLPQVSSVSVSRVWATSPPLRDTL